MPYCRYFLSKKFILILDLIFIFSIVEIYSKHEGNKSPILHNNFHQPKSIEIQQALRDTIRDHIDGDKDGFVSPEELNSWLIKLHKKVIDDDIEKQWVFYDPHEQEVHSWDGYMPERKRVLVWDHYFNATYAELVGKHLNDIDTSDTKLHQLKHLATRAQTQWTAADTNGDSLLTREEFAQFIHPEEGVERTKELFLASAIEDLDTNTDTKVTSGEFLNHIKIIAQEDGKPDDWVDGQRDNFANYLDQDKNGYLDMNELRQWLIPEPNERHLLEVERLFALGDGDNDNQLSTKEIVEHYDQMAVLLTPEFWNRNQGTTSVHFSHSPHDEF